MSVNSSSSSNTSFPPPPLPSSATISYFMQICFCSTSGALNTAAFTIISILFVLPLCILVLYLGVQRWRQQRSSATMSHSDFFTYNMVVIELMGILGTTLIFCGLHTDLPQMLTAGLCLIYLNLDGQLLFHILTCVERYLAVVHPVTYMSLRRAKGIRIRNITTGCVWLLCNAMSSVKFYGGYVFINIFYYCITACAVTVICFCSLSVLRVLIRPGPGEGGGDRQRVDQSKLRAFYTITMMLGVLVFRFGGTMLVICLSNLLKLGETAKCALQLSVVWFSLPSGLVSPLLFLHRAGKLLCCKSNSKSEQRSD